MPYGTVIARGHFEELHDDEALRARKYLYNKILDLLTVSAIHPHEYHSSNPIEDSNRIKEVMYRIKLIEKTGRFESR